MQLLYGISSYIITHLAAQAAFSIGHYKIGPSPAEGRAVSFGKQLQPGQSQTNMSQSTWKCNLGWPVLGSIRAVLMCLILNFQAQVSLRHRLHNNIYISILLIISQEPGLLQSNLGWAWLAQYPISPAWVAVVLTFYKENLWSGISSFWFLQPSFIETLHLLRAMHPLCDKLLIYKFHLYSS